jgi:CheY-like chemotaxis protein
MVSSGEDAVTARGLGAVGQPQPPDVAPETRQDDATILYVPAGGRALRVLVVDDHRDTADSWSALVQIWGYDARVAYDGAAAFELAAAYQPDVLLVDIAMPQMNGCQLVRQLRRQLSLTGKLLVAVTGYADETHRLLCAEAGFDLFLVKPVEPSAMENLLRRHQQQLAGPP